MSSIFDVGVMSRRSLLDGMAATSALVLLHPFGARASANQAHLRIMETTDIHVNVFPYDYYADATDDKLGLSRTATIIDSDPRRGRQLAADRQWRLPAGQSARRFHRLSARHEGRRRPSRDQGDEHARL